MLPIADHEGDLRMEDQMSIEVFDAKIREIRGIAGLLMINQNHDSDCQAAAEAIWARAREIEEILEKEIVQDLARARGSAFGSGDGAGLP